MLLVDTTIWVDFFANHQTQQTAYLVKQIEEQNDLCICGVILTEIFQGIKDLKEQRLIENALDSLIFLEMTQHFFASS